MDVRTFANNRNYLQLLLTLDAPCAKMFHRAALGPPSFVFPMVLAIKTVVDCHVDKECKRRLSLSTCGIPIECLDKAAPALEENHMRLMNVVGDGSYDSDGEEVPSGCWQACHCDDIT